ncbi:MAG: hypothetical protein ACKPKO_01590, partial [Candidatus Fonsibacter sp.]
MNMATPEYYWTQSVVVAMHAVRLAFTSYVAYYIVSLVVAVDELDSLRRQYHLVTVTPSSKYDLANCRVLHSREVTGATIVAG